MATKKATKKTAKNSAKTTKTETVTPKNKWDKFKKTTEACVWQIGTPCGGEVREAELFDHQIRIPICENHLQEHEDIMLLHKNKYDVEEILNQKAEQRRQEVLTLKLSGLQTDEDIEL